MKSTALVVSALFAFLGVMPGEAEPLFSETFDNTTAGSLSVNSAGWNVYRGATAVNIGTAVGVNNGATDGQAGIGSTSGNPTPPLGTLFISNGTAVQGLAYSAVKTFTSSLTIPTISGLNEISWTMGNTDVNSNVRILIQLGGDGSVGSGTWYASTQGFTNNGYSAASFSSASTESVTFSLDFTTTAANWRSYTLLPDSTMSIGAVLTGALPSTAITGIGFYAAPGYLQQSVRLDSLTIIPEPQTVALLVMGAAVFFLRRKPKMTWA